MSQGPLALLAALVYVVLGIRIQFVRFKRRMKKGCRLRPGCLFANLSPSLPAKSKKCGVSENLRFSWFVGA